MPSRRRLDISSLLCPPDHPPTSPAHSPAVPEPVILAPHLRNPALALPSPRPDPAPPPPSSPSPSSDLPRPHADLFRPHPPPRSIDNLIHPPSQPPRHLHHPQAVDSPSLPAQPRPPSSSSSSSLATRSTAGGYTYPPGQSPVVSPLSGLGGYTSPRSPLLHRPSSAHVNRHSVSHRASSSNPYPPPPSPHLGKMAFEALVHAATEERKKLSAGSTPDLAPPPISPLFHRSAPRHHDSDHSLPSSYLRLSRPQYEEEYYHQEHSRLERLRDDDLRERRLQEHHRHLEMQEFDRQRLLEQQRIEKERLLAQQLLVEKMERQREQHRLQGEHEQRRREQHLEEKQRRRLQEDRHRLELERQRREEFELAEERQALEEANQRRLEERRRFEEEQRQRSEERRLYEERLAAEERRREELLRTEDVRHRDERQTEDHKRREEEQRRLVEEQRHREEEYRLRDEHIRRAEQERLLQAQLRVEHDQRPLLTRVYPDKSLPSPHHFPLSPAFTRPLVSRSPPAAFELSQSHHLYPLVTGPHKFDPIQIKHSANHDTQISISTDGEPPLKRQRYSESPPPALTRHVYPTIVALPPPISDDQSYRHGPLAVRHPGSGQGKRLGLNDAIEREGDKERERDRPTDGHRIISPLGRRSPPGSQIGRATAAKKSDEARRADKAAAAAAMADVLKTDETHASVKKVDDIVHPSTPPPHSESTKVPQEHAPIAPEIKVQDSLPSRTRDDVSNKMSLDTVMNDQADVQVKKEPLPTVSFDLLPQMREQQKGSTPGLPPEGDPPSPRSPDLNRVVVHTQTHPQDSCEGRNMKESFARQSQREDVHEWLLDQYAKPPPSSQLPPKPSRSKSPSISLVATKPQPERKLHTPSLEIPKPVIALRSVSPDADAALERELAELMAEEDEVVPVYKHEPDDMDIDLGVAETLEDDKSKVNPMEVDGTDDGADEVENELLSLVDDRPPSTATSGRKAAAPTPPPVLKPPLVKTSIEEGKRPSPASATSPIIRPPSTRPGSDRGSMPPPYAATVQKEKDEEVTRKGDVSTTSAQAAKKKKDAGSKVSAKSKSTNLAVNNGQAVTSNKQQKTKAAATKKAKGVDTASANGISAATVSAVDMKSAARHGKLAGIKKAASNSLVASRSRSTSVMPAGSVDHEAEEKEDDEKEELADDKLYCVCKTKYDEDRFMIACDRCDEWYHTTCVNMPDLEVELVDQFFCPPCLERNPNANLKTTYKQRCLNGLRHPDPDSPKACHKPARGAISKYCSDECGLKYMQSRIDAWAKKGGKKEELWESVKHAEKREGIAVCVDERAKLDLDKRKKSTKVDRETERLQGLLNQVVKTREEVQSSMEIVVWRERLLQLASERAEHIDQCGWDQRLCFGEEEWQDFGPGVLESYDEVKPVKDENGMQVDEAEEEGEWWCFSQKSCKRHAGWQTLRYKDICKEREKKQELLTKLTVRERQLRKGITDLVDPSGRKANERTSQASLKSSKIKMSNGHVRSKGTADTMKKGKKRKAPAS